MKKDSIVRAISGKKLSIDDLDNLYPIEVDTENPLISLIKEIQITNEANDMIELLETGKWAVLTAAKGNDGRIIYRMARFS